MKCRLPPPLTEEQISAFLDGEAEPAVRQHVIECAYCAARVAQARQVEAMMQQQFFRWDCPTAQQLGDYHLGLTGEEDNRRISAHLQHCAHCRAELADLRAFLSAPDPGDVPESPSQSPPFGFSRLRDIVARLAPSPAPALALRGENAGPLVFEAGGVTVFIQLKTVNDVTILEGQLAADDLTAWEGSLVQLHQAHRLQAAAVVDELGGFRFEPFVKQASDLHMAAPGGEAIILRIPA